jgi:hypothetical protein
MFPDELVMLDAHGGVHPRPGKLASAREGDWTWTGVSTRAGAVCILTDAEPTSLLMCTDDAGRREAIPVERVTDPKRRAELEARLANSRPRGDACARAEVCCKRFFATHGSTCDVDAELGRDRYADQCENFLRGTRLILAEEKKPALSECQ